MPRETDKRWSKAQVWSELDWMNRLRLVYLRFTHCLTTGLVPWVQRCDFFIGIDIKFRDWDFESREGITGAEKNFYQERWNQVKLLTFALIFSDRPLMDGYIFELITLHLTLILL